MGQVDTIVSILVDPYGTSNYIYICQNILWVLSHLSSIQLYR